MVTFRLGRESGFILQEMEIRCGGALSWQVTWSGGALAAVRMAWRQRQGPRKGNRLGAHCCGQVGDGGRRGNAMWKESG